MSQTRDDLELCEARFLSISLDYRLGEDGYWQFPQHVGGLVFLASPGFWVVGRPDRPQRPKNWAGWYA